MPTVFGHKLRWVEDECGCTVCGKEYDGSWVMVKNFTTGDLYCRDCLETWREQAKADHLVDEMFAKAHNPTKRRPIHPAGRCGDPDCGGPDVDPFI